MKGSNSVKKKYLLFLFIFIILSWALISGAGCANQSPLKVSIDSVPSSVFAGQTINVAWSVSGVQDTFYHGAVHYGPFSVSDPQDTSDYPNHLNEECNSGCQSPGTFTSEFSISTPGTYYYRVHVIYNGSDYWSNEESIVVTGSGTSGGIGGQGYAQTVSITTSSFDPQIVFAVQGGTILWVNNDNMTHTVTSDSGNELNSPIIPPGATYAHTFTKVGTYPYHCNFRPYLTGSVVVD